MKYRVIERFRGKYSVDAMCKVFEVTRSGYYAWRVSEYIDFYNFERISLKNGLTPVEIRGKAASTILNYNGVLLFSVYCSGYCPAASWGINIAYCAALFDRLNRIAYLSSSVQGERTNCSMQACSAV